MKKILNGLFELGVKNGDVKMERYESVVKVTVDGEYFGLWDLNKNTFVD